MFNTYFIDPIKNHYLDFGGKATRTQYWAFYGWNFLVFAILGMVALGLYNVSEVLGGIVLLLVALFSLAIFLPYLAISARRLRDGGFSPWLLLIGLIPTLGGLILLILFLLPSKE